MSDYVVTIPGILRGKQRARITVRGGIGRGYTPAQTVNAEAWVKQCCVDQVGQPCLWGPLSVKVSIGVPIPASWSKRDKSDAIAGSLLPVNKPDVDNCIKLVFDALNEVLWKDDSQIVQLSVAKSYAETPTTVLAVDQI